jgi:hypothetical protein
MRSSRVSLFLLISLLNESNSKGASRRMLLQNYI